MYFQTYSRYIRFLSSALGGLCGSMEFRLVNVCQRWRYIIFASPHRLDFRLLCTETKHARELLNVWSPLLVVIYFSCSMILHPTSLSLHSSNVIAYPRFGPTGKVFKGWPATVMQDPFPALTHFGVKSYDLMSAVLPDAFLGGSAARLRHLHLEGIPFPAFPRLFFDLSAILSVFDSTGYQSWLLATFHPRQWSQSCPR
ncbi:hypothetical protein BJV78DRAFT_320863 [Lactifluus subvellereus]|nr:hypothetical protein BJV78DRAFT_320863 [Lactifluus subvellereus]